MADDPQGRVPERSPEAIAVDIAIRLGLLGLIAYWSLQIVGPFVSIVVWAVILAVAIYPVHQWLARRLGGREGAASILITIVGLCIVLGPAAALSLSLFENVQSLAVALREGRLAVPVPPEGVRGWPIIGDTLFQTWSLAATNLEELLRENRPLLVSTAGSIIGRLAGVLGGILALAISLIIAGFLYGHGGALAEGAHRVSRRIVLERGDAFIDLAGATIRNVSRGVIGVSLLQTLLVGIGLLAIGAPGVGLISFGALILSIIQIGPAILLLGVVIWAWSALDTVTALVFTLYCIPVALLDNVLKPIVMARGLQTPMLVILIGVIGGTFSHGLIGLFLGPIILAVLYELLKMWVTIAPPTEPRRRQR